MTLRSSLPLLVFAAALVPITGACRNRDNAAERIMDDPTRSLATARCGGTGQIVRPLIIEWPATDRASLEGRLGRGVVVVRYEGCVVEVMRECSVPATGYDYLAITRKNDHVVIRSADELYASLPLTAVELEAKLAKAGELDIAMALVGNFEAQRSRFDIAELEGRCQGATHVIAAAQVGAFELYAGSGAEIGTSVEVENVGVGGRSSASRELLNKDGDAAACERSMPGDVGPPAQCGALLRLELTALDGIVPTCQPGSVWNGSACVVPSTERPVGTGSNGQPGNERAPEDHVGSEIARQVCTTQMQCQAESLGTVVPEGDTYVRQIGRCVKMIDAMLNDYSRPMARKCLETYERSGCGEFGTCMSGDSLESSNFDEGGEGGEAGWGGHR
ncbi:hypothetical protein ACNOYE_20720 [Nannocystaceae bacterium ST9]